MKHSIHHIHVTCGPEIFTIIQKGESISLAELMDFISEILILIKKGK